MRRAPDLVLVTVAALAGVACGALAGCGGSERAGSAAGVKALQASADYVAVTLGGFDSFGPSTKLDPAQASLVGPHSAVAFSGVVTTPSISGYQVAALGLIDPQAKQGLRPADGHEFLILRTVRAEVPWMGVGSEPPTTAMTLRTGGESRPLNKQFGGDHTLTLSVRSGQEATLVLTDEGRVQTLDLRTGRRGGDPIPLYYPLRVADVKGSFGSWARVSGVTVDGMAQGNLIAVGGTSGRATLHPFRSKLGWARPGRAWLEVGIGRWTDMLTKAVITVDVAASFTLTTPDGTRISPVPGTGDIRIESVISADTPTSIVMFDVPDSFRSGAVGFAPRGTIVATVNGQQKTGTISSHTPSKPATISLPA
jgi:hypothetical protein